jgi:hypothetical protein
VSDIQKESQAVLDSITDNNFYGLLKRGRYDGVDAYVPKATILKEMAAKMQYVKPQFFYLVREFSDEPRS